MLYSQLLVAHNLIRWLVLIAGVFALVSSASGWIGNRPASPALRRFSAVFVGALDLQFLVGLILYFGLSPITKVAFQNMSAAMKDHELRFFTVEHTIYMLIAIILAHIGSRLARRGSTDRKKFRGATICYALTLVIILAGIPWWRPFIRWVS